MNRKKDDYNLLPNMGLGFCLASPESILDLSYGEVLSPETKNYRTGEAEKKGLYCPRIFGYHKDWICKCGKFKGIKSKGIICDNCKVEVNTKRKQRERFGHIAFPPGIKVVHPYFYRGQPNYISVFLNLHPKDLEDVIFYSSYLIIQRGIAKDWLISNSIDRILTLEQYKELMKQFQEDNRKLPKNHPDRFIAEIGGIAIESALKKINVDKEIDSLKRNYYSATSQVKRKYFLKRLTIFLNFKNGQKWSNIKLEWMVLQHILVLPAEIRPLFTLAHKQIWLSDLVTLYESVVLSVQRVKKSKQLKLPNLLIFNDLRFLQDSVEALFDNSKKEAPVKERGTGRILKSLTDMGKGKSGLFRQNGMAKRTDYSGRAPIAVNETLKIHQCGLPKTMALRLFEPFVKSALLQRGIVNTLKEASHVINKREDVVWDILDKCIQGYPVLINRAPTLHRLNIQAFFIVLVEGDAVQMNPLLFESYNADCDGDQVGIQLLLTVMSNTEAILLMLTPNNILSPANGKPIITPAKDMVAGLYYMTMSRGKKVINKTFVNPEEVLSALNQKIITLHNLIKVRLPNRDKERQNASNKYKIVETTAGRLLFNRILPKDFPFINFVLRRQDVKNIVLDVFKTSGRDFTANFLDNLKDFGFAYARQSGLTFCFDDIKKPPSMDLLMKEAEMEVEEINNSYHMGFITNNECYDRIIDEWSHFDQKLKIKISDELKNSNEKRPNGIFIMMDSNARGSIEQTKQMIFRGLVVNLRKKVENSKRTILENPIKHGFISGLSLRGFIASSQNARFSISSSALSTAKTGYITRKMINATFDVIIKQKDCTTIHGTKISPIIENDTIIQSLGEQALGRVLHEDIWLKNEKLFSKGTLITTEIGKELDKKEIPAIKIRSPLSCRLPNNGICATCYGINLSTLKMVELGTPIGILASQSISEPSTQIQLDVSKRRGSNSLDFVQSSIKAVFSGKILLKNLDVIDSVDSNGKKIKISLGKETELYIIDPHSQKMLIKFCIPYGSSLFVKDQVYVEKGEQLCSWDAYNICIIARKGGRVSFSSIKTGVNFKEKINLQTGSKDKIVIASNDKKIPKIIIRQKNAKEEQSYILPINSYLKVEENELIKPGHILAKIPREIVQESSDGKNRSKIETLLEARKIFNKSILAPVDGLIEYGKVKRGSREIILKAKNGCSYSVYVPFSQRVLVQDGDFVHAGHQLSNGEESMEDILTIYGYTKTANYFVNTLNSVYLKQGIFIGRIHFEVLARCIMKNYIVLDGGDTDLLPEQIISYEKLCQSNKDLLYKYFILDKGDSNNIKEGSLVDRYHINSYNKQLKKEGEKLIVFRDPLYAKANTKITSLTKISTLRKGLDAISFQQLSKMLARACINSEREEMLSAKVNIISGGIVAMGTGFYKSSDVKNF